MAETKTPNIPKTRKSVADTVTDAANALKRALRRYEDSENVDADTRVRLATISVQAQRLALDLTEAALTAS